jgi:hypothetical protein
MWLRESSVIQDTVYSHMLLCPAARQADTSSHASRRELANVRIKRLTNIKCHNEVYIVLV